MIPLRLIALYYNQEDMLKIKALVVGQDGLCLYTQTLQEQESKAI